MTSQQGQLDTIHQALVARQFKDHGAFLRYLKLADELKAYDHCSRVLLDFVRAVPHHRQIQEVFECIQYFFYLQRKIGCRYRKKKYLAQIERALIWIANQVRPLFSPQPAHTLPQPGQKIRVAIVTSLLIDTGSAITNMIVDLIKRLDRNRFDIVLVSTEQYTGPKDQAKLLSFYTYNPSRVRGQQTLKWLADQGVEVCLAEAPYPYLERLGQVIQFLNDRGVDTVMYHCSMFDILADLLVLLNIRPFHVNCIHSYSMSVKGLDVVTSFCEASYRQDQAFWSRRKVQHHLLGICRDWDDIDRQKKGLSRSQLGIGPEDRVMVVSGNYLETIFSPAYTRLISRILSEFPFTRFMIIGQGRFEKFRHGLQRKGLDRRVLFVGHQQNVFPFLNCSDIYVNPFPDGQGVGVLEAMGLGLACVAIQWSSIWQQAIGASYLGNHAIRGRDPQAYYQRLRRLVTDSDYLATQKREQKNRARSVFSWPKMIQKIEGILVPTSYDKIKQNVPG